MIKIAILNKDGFYSKLLASKLSSIFPKQIKRISAFNTKEDVAEHLAMIIKYDLIIVGDGICDDYPQLIKILKDKKVIANSKRFVRNKTMLDAGADWVIPKDVIFDSCKSLNVDVSEVWKKPICQWFFQSV